jgi:hypothetical protein
MMEAIKTALAVIGGYTLAGTLLSIWQWARDRSGNSGRSGKHWSEED